MEGASDPSEQKEEQPEVAEEKGPEPKVSIQDMAELLQKVAEGEEQGELSRWEVIAKRDVLKLHLKLCMETFYPRCLNLLLESYIAL